MAISMPRVKTRMSPLMTTTMTSTQRGGGRQLLPMQKQCNGGQRKMDSISNHNDGSSCNGQQRQYNGRWDSGAIARGNEMAAALDNHR
jgi:hypothetical protein